jgi:predicted ATPase
MLTKLAFKNFKAWKDSGEIRLAPLTVFFGANSAGKSSITQLLLLLKQTAASPDRQQALQLGDGRTVVDLGTFDDVVHDHDLSHPLEFALEWSLENSMKVLDPISKQEFSGTALRFEASLVVSTRRQPIVDFFRYELQSGGNPTLDLKMGRNYVGSSRAMAREGKAQFELTSSRYSLTRRHMRAWALPEPFRFYGFPDEVTAYFQNTAFAADLVLELERVLSSIFYVGPLREYPRRLYLWSGEIPEHVGTKGDRAIEAILAAGHRSFNLRPRQKTKYLPALIAERLRDMGLIRDFEVKALGEHRKEYEVLVRTNPKLPLVKLTDVGFGVSQVLPVIVECFYVPKRSIVIFEQPEIHLHPRVQADLADLFVDAICAREDSGPRDCQFIIESHSEHFLRRLQRRIAEKELSKEHAALYFIDTQGGSARIQELDLDLFGNIANWPEGFFGDEMADAVARSEAQARRMSQGEKGE